MHSAGSVEGLVKGARERSAPLTPLPSPFDEVWPQVNTSLISYLCRRGATFPQAQDISQEVALKVLTRDVAFTSAQDLLRWCYPVARNALVDEQRTASRIYTVPDVGSEEETGVDVVDRFDTHVVVESRLRLQRVLAGIRQLSAADQTALAPFLADDGPAEPADRTESTRLAVRRHRARNRLVALVGPAAAALGWALGPRPARPTRLQPTLAAAGVSFSIAVAVVVAPVLDAPAAPRLAPLVTRLVDLGTGTGTGAPTPRDAAGTGARASSVTSTAPTSAPYVDVRDEVRAEVPAAGVAVATGTRAPRGRELVCAGGLSALRRTCVDRPFDLPPPAEPVPAAAGQQVAGAAPEAWPGAALSR